MVLDLIFKSITTASTAANTINSLIKTSKGLKRGLLIELKKNIYLLDSYIKNDLDLKKTITELEDECFKNTITTDFNFNTINGKKISNKTINGVNQFKKYLGWTTEKFFINIYLKIDNLKKIIKIEDIEKTKINIKFRLINIYKLMLLLAKHIG